ncbi:MAG TPA: DNA replication/repair protein RecF [bacterium]|nr:DNA replication/repair protein RecF [bacterium]
MHIQKILLTNFRNFAAAEVEFAERRNLIVGPNAQGKTNLLEAIHILGLGRSQRDRRDQNLVRFGETFYRIEGIFQHIGVKTTIEVTYSEDKKRIKINGKDARPATLLGVAPVVASSPEDIDMIKRSPGYRRTFLDLALSQVSREYLATLQSYARALAQRNMLLKRAQDGRVARGETDVWDEAIINLGEKVVTARIGFLAEITPKVGEATRAISGTASKVALPYDPKGYMLGNDWAAGEGSPELVVEALGQTVRDSLRRALAESRAVEAARGFTLFGPHVDDFKFICDGRDIRLFGSEGEQRTSVIALRAAEVALVKAKLGHHPIVLLDDVFAELDDARSRALTALISEFDQIVLTSSRPGALDESGIRRIVVAAGGITYHG